ncbi:helix-turn-helix domain-containing protein [Burkholderia sp. SCN-KJ]|uniref:AraC-like ligand-binding domain-containing protein n=1 Tax=Burkholderia sp. SCN-KJ TaxID=2969248 RepID=UPI002150595C|nr:helix-turn-helix domain-containing protein [Burkholderia sp. SCN-KJ]MCR4471584.1 helix-turn-helix domain-containing protein [Burkholderia sp. SCN-KJ]
MKVDAEINVTSVNERERYGYWHETVCRLVCRTDTRRTEDDLFQASVRRSALGRLSLSTIECSALEYDRSSITLQQAPIDDFLISVLLEGEGRLSQAGRDTIARPGEFVMYDTARPYIYEFPQPYKLHLLQVPRNLMLSHLPNAENLTAITISKDSPLGAIVNATLAGAISLDMSGKDAPAFKLASSLLNVISATFEHDITGFDAGTDRLVGLRERAKRHMLAHLDDPDLEIDSIARAVGASARSLSRAFATDGTTAIRWLWQQRLQASYRTLLEAKSTRIADVAIKYGFSNFSHFSRVFRQAYGYPPSELNRAASLSQIAPVN